MLFQAPFKANRVVCKWPLFVALLRVVFIVLTRAPIFRFLLLRLSRVFCASFTVPPSVFFTVPPSSVVLWGSFLSFFVGEWNRASARTSPRRFWWRKCGETTMPT